MNDHNKILSVGYNGMPTGCNDDDMPWEREGDPLHTKYFYVCHEELNAILNYGGGSLDVYKRQPVMRSGWEKFITSLD